MPFNLPKLQGSIVMQSGILRHFQQKAGHCVGYVAAWIRCRAQKDKDKDFWDRYFIPDSMKGYVVNPKGKKKIEDLMAMESEATKLAQGRLQRVNDARKNTDFSSTGKSLTALDDLLSDLEFFDKETFELKDKNKFDKDQWARDYICFGRRQGKPEKKEKKVLNFIVSSLVNVEGGYGITNRMNMHKSTYGLLSVAGGASNHAIGFDLTKWPMVYYFDPNLGEVAMRADKFSVWLVENWKYFGYTYPTGTIDIFAP